MAATLVLEKAWLDKSKFDDAERHYYEFLASPVRVAKLEKENSHLQKIVADLKSKVTFLESRVVALEGSSKVSATQAAKPDVVKSSNSAPAAKEDDDDDVDLFASDEDEGANELREQRLKEYAEKKSKKKAIIAKSSVVLEVKPWDDETDMEKLTECVRSIEMDGLLWGTSKLVPIAFGVRKLQIVCVVEDDKVSIEELTEKIEAFEDYVQSVDVAAFNKI